jgi:hypothetical protein
MNWNCAQTEERLSDFIDGLMTPEEAAVFSVHIGSCVDCSQLYRSVSGLVNQMQALPSLQQPEPLIARIVAATLGSRPEKQGWKRWFSWTPAIFTPRFAMGAATVAVLLVVVFRVIGVTPGKIKRADLSPASIARSANSQVHLDYARSAKFVNDLRVVYEIQSAFQRTQDQPPSMAPQSAPQEEHQSAPAPSNPQEKSQKDAHPRSQIQNGVMVAWIVAVDFPRSTR